MAVSKRDRREPSSPDLLALPIDDATSSPARPSKRVNLGTPRRKIHIGTDSSMKIQDFYINTPTAPRSQKSSPMRSLAQTEDLISPWRIRVRVEAEHESVQDENRQGRARASLSPKKLFGADTRTTTIPIKGGEDEYTSPKKGRGRPRKSDGPVKARPATPNPHAARRRSSLADKSLEEATETNTAPTPAPRKRGRPSDSTRRSGQGNNLLGVAKSSEPRPPAQVDMSTSGRGRRGRRKTLGPVEIAADPDVEMVNNNEFLNGDGLLEEKTASLFTEDADTLKRPLQERSSLSPQKGQHDPERPLRPKRRKLLDPTDHHEEFDSIMESEGFTMITLGSLPSAQHLKSRLQESPQSSAEPSSPAQANQPSPMSDDFDHNQMPARGLPSSEPRVASVSVQNVATGIEPSPSLLSRTSQLFGLFKQKTPSQAAPSPMLPPSAPVVQPVHSPPAVNKPNQGTPKLVRVVRAGIALQGVLDTEDQRAGASYGSASNTPLRDMRESSPKERLDDLFSGFGASTRRELRAGLRLGEELAKRQRESTKEPSSAPVLEDDDDVFSDHSAAGVRPVSSSPPYTLAVPEPPSFPMYPKLSPGRQHEPEDRLNQQPSPDRLRPSESGMLGKGAAAAADFRRPPIPTPEDSLERNDVEEMSWRHDPPYFVPQPSQADKPTPSTSSAAGSMPPPQRPSRAEEREAEWQLEREAVSKQIQEAETDRVVVVSSDDPALDAPLEDDESDDDMHDDGGLGNFADDDVGDENEEVNDDMHDANQAEADGETVDIWQLEAQSSSIANRPSINTFDPPRTAKAPAEPKTKPPRSKLPTPWRSHNDRKLVYSDDVEQDQSPQSGQKHPHPDASPGVRKRPKVDPTPPPESEDEEDELVQPSPARKYPDSVEKRVRSRLLGEVPASPQPTTAARDVPEVVPSRTINNPATSHAAHEVIEDGNEDISEDVDEDVIEDPVEDTSSDIDDDTVEPTIEPTIEATIEHHTSNPVHPSLPPNRADTTTFSTPSDISIHSLQAWSPPFSLPSSGSLTSVLNTVHNTVQSLVTSNLPRLSKLSMPFLSSGPCPPSSQPRSIFTLPPSAPPGSSRHPAPPPHLTVHLPWTTTHFRRLDAVYSDGLAHPLRYERLGEHSTAGKLVGKAVRSFGWEKRLEGWECGVIEGFMRVLEDEGVVAYREGRGQRGRSGRGEEATVEWGVDGGRIDEEEVARRVFGLWCGRVMRGRLQLREEKVGLWDESLVRYRDRALRRQKAWRESRRQSGARLLWG